MSYFSSADCPYGDRASGCTAKLCSDPDNLRHCCHTCGTLPPATSSTAPAAVTTMTTGTVAACNDVSTGSPFTCQQLVAKRGRAACYTWNDTCCATCRELREASGRTGRRFRIVDVTSQVVSEIDSSGGFIAQRPGNITIQMIIIIL